MTLEQFQVNTKFLNTLPAKWSKFITDVKLVKDLHTTNVDQIYAHLEQHERHIDVNEDTCTWSLGPNGTFTVKDARYRIDQNILFPLLLMLLLGINLSPGRLMCLCGGFPWTDSLID
ncbi:hypothetical protein Tco_0395195, partial [Tanacetum coccineum]